ncbi:MAG: lysophospholipid acyltransferase family protein [Clostridia bacterium]
MIEIKLRHKIINTLARPIISLMIKKRFNYKYTSCDIKPPFIVLGNHTTDYDAFFIAKSFKNPIYFVMSDHITTIPVLGKLIKYAVSPIPITKSSLDPATIRDIFSVIKQGSAIGLFPEGNKSFSGDMSYIKPSTSKLLKKLNVPVVIYNIKGGYFSSPRWSKEKRTGHVCGFVRKIIMPEELNKMSTDELYNEIVSSLRINAYDEQEKEKQSYNIVVV